MISGAHIRAWEDRLEAKAGDYVLLSDNFGNWNIVRVKEIIEGDFRVDESFSCPHGHRLCHTDFDYYGFRDPVAEYGFAVAAFAEIDEAIDAAKNVEIARTVMIDECAEPLKKLLSKIELLKSNA